MVCFSPSCTVCCLVVIVIRILMVDVFVSPTKRKSRLFHFKSPSKNVMYCKLQKTVMRFFKDLCCKCLSLFSRYKPVVDELLSMKNAGSMVLT